MKSKWWKKMLKMKVRLISLKVTGEKKEEEKEEKVEE